MRELKKDSLEDERVVLSERLREAEKLLAEIVKLSVHLEKTQSGFLTYGHECRLRKFLGLLPRGSK